jgi:FMN phosphatase YigB (HAD superfamily)
MTNLEVNKPPSCELRTRKTSSPHEDADTDIYTETLKLLGILPENAVFIDDNLSYTTNADSMGLTTIHYQKGTPLKKELAKKLIIKH